MEKPKKLNNEVKMYIRSDGNGGIVIHKGMIAFLTILIILATTFASVVAFSAGVKNDVQHNTEKLASYETKIDTIGQKADTNKESVGKIETNIDNMKDDLAEIKADVKSLIKQHGGGSP